MEAVQKFYIEDNQLKNIDDWQETKENGVIYEVIRIIKCKPLFYEEHYERMVNSCKLANGYLNIGEEEMVEQIRKLVKANKVSEGNIKLTYSIERKSLKLFYIKHSYPTEKMYLDGVETILYYGERDNPNAKIVNKTFREKVNEKLKSTGAYEAVLVDRNNLITEGSKSNIFLIKDYCLYTSKVENVLPGVTRTEIIKLAKNNDISVFEEDIKVENLEDFEAMFISGTSPKILPINKVNNKKLNTKNECLKEIMTLFSTEIEKYLQ